MTVAALQPEADGEPAGRPTAALHEGGARFSVQLSLAAEPAQLEAWLAAAAPMDRETYASGFDLPREAPGVKLAQKWQREGLVDLNIARDPHDRRRQVFLIVKLAPKGKARRVAPAEVVGGDSGPRAEMRAMLDVLQRCAMRREPCPSDREFQKLLGLRTRHRAKYLMQRLVAEKRIAVENRGTLKPRVVTILKSGKETAR